MNDIILGDALAVLRELPDGFAQLVLTDPPYKISRPNNFHTMGREGFSWGWDLDFDIHTYLPEIVRVIAPGGSLVICNAWQLLGAISAHCVALGMLEKDPIVGEKANPQPRNTSRRYVSDKEFAVWLVKPGANWTFNKRDGYPYERSTTRFPVPRPREHPTKKSPEWMETLIQIHSNPGDQLLDPFAGEGTIGAVAARLGRSCLSVEKDPKFHAFALQQLRGTKCQTT